MAAKKVKRYEVLIPCRKGDEKPRQVGSIVTSKDFTAAEIKKWGWLELGVLREVSLEELKVLEELDDGCNA